MKSETSSATIINTLEAIALFIGLTSITWHSLGLLGGLLITDFFFGILKTLVINGRKGLKSEKAIKGLGKKLCLLFAPLVMQVMGEAVQIDVSSLVYGIFSVIVFAEGYSIYENMRAIGEGRHREKVDLFSKIMKRVSVITDSLLKSQNLDEENKKGKM